MQIHRLTEIVFALLKDERVTAKDLAERFEVSTRTIYRDIDILSGAGIPIFTDKGNGGGISIAENYRLEKAILSDAEKQNILAMLTAFNASVNNQDSASLLDKLSGVFKTANNFIEVDFSDWDNDNSVQLVFDVLKNCIINKKVAQVTYCNADGEENMRELEPLKLIFKSRNWYLYAYCRLRKENRLFKLARIGNIVEICEKFDRKCDETDIAKKIEWTGDVTDISLKMDKSLKNRMRDMFPKQLLKTDIDGNFIVQSKIPSNDWALSFILSFGDKVEVLEPLWLKEKIKEIHKRAAEI